MAEPVAAVRSPSDILRMVVAACAWLLLLAIEVVFGSAIVRFASDLLRGTDAIDPGLLTGIVVAARIAAVGVLAVLAVAAVRSGGARVLATVAVGVGTGAAAFALTRAVIDTEGSTLVVLEDVAGTLTSGSFPTDWGLALGTAAVVALAPWLRRSGRRSAWTAALVLVVAHALATPISATPLAALVSGWLGGSIAVVLLGAPSMRPTVPAVITGLRSVGLAAAVLEPASVDARGSTPYLGRTTDGTPVFVKVLGRDERSADLLFRLYRSVTPGSFGDERPFSSLRRGVEHEALLALAVRDLGVRTPAVLALADAEPGGWVLAYSAVSGRSLDGVAAAALTDDVLEQTWQHVATLRAHRIAHRDLRLANLFLDDDGAVWIIDFGFAELAAAPMLLATDVAELLVSLSVRTSAPRALRAARAAVGDAALLEARGRLAPKYLSGATRAALRDHAQLLDDLRAAIGPTTPDGTHRGRFSAPRGTAPPNGSRRPDHRAR